MGSTGRYSFTSSVPTFPETIALRMSVAQPLTFPETIALCMSVVQPLTFPETIALRIS